MVARFQQTWPANSPADPARLGLEAQHHLPNSILTIKPGFVISKIGFDE
jgi:hypothetical protein